MVESVRPDQRKSGPSPAERALGDVARRQEVTADRTRAVTRPWYFDAPGVAVACARVVLAPLLLMIKLAEAAVALALLAAIGVVVAWHQGYIADKDVVAALRPLGQRILAMVQSGGM